MALYGWDSPDDGRRVLLSERIVLELRTLAINGFVALPRRGVEVGGILFGEAGSGEVRIEGFEEVSCEHRYGPSYALSEADRAVLSEILAARRGGRLPVVGFFRSFTARDPVIEQADETFVREHFPSGDFVYLMLKPLSAENCVASFRFFRDGELLSEETEGAAFAFDPRQMAIPEPAHALAMKAQEEPPAPPQSYGTWEEAADTETPAMPPPYRARLGAQETEPLAMPAPYRMRQEVEDAEPARRRVRWWIPALVCLASAVAGAVIFELWTLERAPRWTELHLDARPVGGRLQVSWDGNAPRAVHAMRGLLAVTDGDIHRDLYLDPGQILAGKYVYTPSHAEVALRLILYANGLGVTGDAIRVAGLPNATPPSRVPSPEAQPAASADRAAPIETPAEPESVAVPPSAVHEVQPHIPEGIRSRLAEQVVIPVEVEVNERGRVVRAVAEMRSGDGVRRYLAEQAQKAAREWRFTPARTKAGEHVAASKTIDFVFAPSGGLRTGREL